MEHAEWIYERSEVNSTFPFFAKPSNLINITDANVEVGSSRAGVGEWPQTTLNMYDLGYDDAEGLDARPTAINSAGNAFGFAWKSYGDVDSAPPYKKTTTAVCGVPQDHGMACIKPWRDDMRCQWIPITILVFGTTACGSNVGTAIPQPLWPAPQRWLASHAHPSQKVVFVGTSSHPSAPGFHGTSVFNTDTAIEFSVDSMRVSVPRYAMIDVTVSPKPPHRVVAVSYELLHGHIWHTIFSTKYTAHGVVSGEFRDDWCVAEHRPRH